MGRRFTSASSEEIVVGAAGTAGLSYTFGTIAVVVRFVSLPSAANGLLYDGPGSGAAVEFLVTSGGAAAYYDGTTQTNGTTGIATATNYLLGVTKATGNVIGRTHLYNFATNTWTHTALGGNNQNGTASSLLWLGSGGGSDFLNGDLWAVGIWQGVVMTDSEFERLARGNWLNFAPSGYAQFSDGREFGDMASTLGRYPFKQTSRTGTTRGAVVAPPGFRLDNRARRR